jgi:diphthamide synthase (EF-2-diphthine--ammonia ligase)
MSVGAEQFDYRIRGSVPLFSDRSDALVPFALLPAMHERIPLVVPGTVSPKLLANVGTAQDILASFSDGDLAPTEIHTEPAATPSEQGIGVASFFSGGVDSFYTLIKNDADLSHLIFVHGFDVFDPTTPRGVAAAETARAVAKAFGKKLIEIETNLQEHTDVFMAFGATLGTFALFLQGQLQRVLVPLSYSYHDLAPCGSHPLLDPLWGTESLEIVHDGCEATRTEKVALIATSDVALRHLRVCNSQHTKYNCGTCPKCLNTMISLQLAGALDRCTTLPSTISFGQISKIEPHEPKANYRANLDAARRARDRRMTLLSAWILRPRPILAMRHRLGRLRNALRRRARSAP